MEVVRYVIPKPPHGSAEWLRARWADADGNKLLNASTFAAIFGRHSFVTPAELAAQMLAPEPPQPEPLTLQDPRYRGIALEDALLRVYEEHCGISVLKSEVIYVGNRIAANLDGELPGVPRHVECKTTRRYYEGELWQDWVDQGWAQCIATGNEGVEWVILDGHLDIHIVSQDCTDQATMDMYLEAAERWLSFIDMGMWPEGVEPTYDDALRARPPQPGDVELDADTAALVIELGRHRRALREQIKTLEQEESMIKARIHDLLGGHTTGLREGTPLVWFTKRGGRRIVKDLDRLVREHPDVAAEFVDRAPDYYVLEFAKGVLTDE